MTELAGPKSPAEIYLARGDVPRCRPLLTGDVFDDIEIPGVDDGAGLAMVLAHPCSMREGPHVRSHVQTARVTVGPPISLQGWRGSYGVMPLPSLRAEDDDSHRAVFELSGRVATALLAPERRIVCLDDPGIVLLLQRRVFSLTRVAVDLDVIHASIAPVLEEAALLEDWLAERTAAEVATADWPAAVAREEESFDIVMRQELDGLSMRKRLEDGRYRPAVNRHVREQMRA